MTGANIMLMNKKKPAPREDVARRLKIADGHLRKIIEMVEGGVYCVDILQQTAAVKSAIKKAEEILLINHMNHCVVKAINSNGKDKAIKELAAIFKKAG